MSWDRIVGHEKAKSFLVSALQRNSIGHAYLFAGPRGVGKSLLAESFAKAANCESGPGRYPNPSGQHRVPGYPCDRCKSCRCITLRTHPDVSWVEPEGGHVKIDQIRYVSRLVQFRPVQGPYRFVIIQKAEKCTPEASNAMLKLLEEPPDKCVFVLESSAYRSLPPTVLSRCQLVKLSGLPIQRVVDYLRTTEGVRGISPGMLLLAARMSGGSIGLSQEMLTKGELRRYAEVATRLAECAIRYRKSLAEGGDDPKLVIEATELVDGISEPELLIAILLAVIRDMLVLADFGEDRIEDMMVVDSSTARGLCELVTGSRRYWERVFEVVIHIGQAFGKNVNRDLAMDALVMAFMKDGNLQEQRGGLDISAGGSGSTL